MSLDTKPIIHVVDSTVVKIYRTWTQVILPNGAVINGIPMEDQKPIAEEMGFRDIVEMCTAHDPMHVTLCGLLGLDCSYALRVASGEEEMTEREQILAGLEEDAVLAVLKFKAQVRKLPK